VHPLTVAVAVACAVSTACTRTVKLATWPSEPVFGNVKRGDLVEVTLKDGRIERFYVEIVETDALVSTRGARYERAEIAVLKRRGYAAVMVLAGAVGAFAVYNLVLLVKFLAGL
jgi:hypothetical protein